MESQLNGFCINICEERDEVNIHSSPNIYTHKTTLTLILAHKICNTQIYTHAQRGLLYTYEYTLISTHLGTLH